MTKLRETALMRRFAAECRDLARLGRFRADEESQDRLLEMAREHEAMAARVGAEYAAEEQEVEAWGSEASWERLT